MPVCSLCGADMPAEGGAVLFADSHGVPFEVCGVCEAHVDALRNAQDGAVAGDALGYISAHAENLARRDTYDSLVAFIGANRAHISPEADEEPETEAEDTGPDESSDAVNGDGKRSVSKSVVFIAAIVALIVLVYLLGGKLF